MSKKLKTLITLLLLIVLFSAIGITFLLSPSVQKRILLSQLKDHAEQVDIDYFSATFSRIKAEGLLFLPKDGGQAIALDKLNAKYSLMALLGGDVLIDSLTVDGLEIETLELAAAPQEDAPQPSEPEQPAQEPWQSPFTILQNTPSGKLRLSNLSVNGVYRHGPQSYDFSLEQKSGDAAPETPALFSLEASATEKGFTIWQSQGVLTLTAGSETGINAITTNLTLEDEIGTMPTLTVEGNIDVSKKSLQATVTDGGGAPLQINATENASGDFTGEVNYKLTQQQLALFITDTKLPQTSLNGALGFTLNPHTQQIKGSGSADYETADILAFAQGYDFDAVPANGSLAYDVELSKQNVLLKNISINLESNAQQWLRLKQERPLELDFDNLANVTDDNTGEVLSLQLTEFPLSLLSPAMEDIDISTGRADGLLSLYVLPDGTFEITAVDETRIRNLSATRNQQPFINELSLGLYPKLKLKEGQWEMTAGSVSIESQQQPIASGDFSLSSKQIKTSFTLNTQGLRSQPFAAPALKSIGSNDYEATASLVSTTDQQKPRFEKLALTLKQQGKDSSLNFELLEPATVDIDQWQNTNASFRLLAKDFSLDIAEPFLPDFDQLAGTINGAVGIQMNGKTFAIEKSVLTCTDLTITRSGKAIIDQLDLSLEAHVNNAHAGTITYEAQIKSIGQDGVEYAKGSLSGTLTKSLIPENLSAKLDARNLAMLMRQPILKPYSNMLQGQGAMQLDYAQGSIDARVLLENVRLRTGAGGITTAAITTKGVIAQDLSRLDLKGDVNLRGNIGTSQFTYDLLANKIGQTGETWQIKMPGQRLIVDDFRTLAKAFQGEASAEPNIPPQAQPSNAPTKNAESFWGSRNGTASVTLRELIYEDNRIQNLNTNLIATPKQLRLSELSGILNEGELSGTVQIDFDPAQRKPYAHQAKLTVANASVGKFIGGANPVLTGIGNAEIISNGKSANLDEFLDSAPFSFVATAQEGLFSLIPKDALQIKRGDNPLSAIGKVATQVALRTTIEPLQDIPYRLARFEVTRSDDRKVKIPVLSIIAEDIRIVGAGGIDYRQGLDLVDRPLAIGARLDARGKYAQLLNKYGLLEVAAETPEGFSQGPQFRVGGSLDDPTNNLYDIIFRAVTGRTGSGVQEGGQIIQDVLDIFGN